MTLLRAFNKMFPSLYVSNDIIVWDDTAEEAKWKPWTSRFGVAMVKSKMKEKEDGGTGAEKKG